MLLYLMPKQKNKTSDQSIEKNNFGGWRYDEEYLTFPSPEAGIIYHSMMLEKKRNTWDYANLSEFSGIYTQNDKTRPNKKWVNNVTSFLAVYKDNEEEYFILEEEIEKDSSEMILAMSLSE